MGEIAARLSDFVFVTDDNPRTEDPAAVRKDILAGLTGAHVRECAPRERAIEEAASWLRQQTELPAAIVLAGKGHESYQIIGAKKEPFDDSETLRAQLKKAAENPDREGAK